MGHSILSAAQALLVPERAHLLGVIDQALPELRTRFLSSKLTRTAIASLAAAAETALAKHGMVCDTCNGVTGRQEFFVSWDGSTTVLVGEKPLSPPLPGRSWVHVPIVVEGSSHGVD